VTGCLAVHDRVVASGTCVGCGLPVQLTGPIGPEAGAELVWLAVPFLDIERAATCRTTGDLHVVEHARGACTGCSAVVEAVKDPKGGGLWWFE
jgi:hypothetical protein